MNSKQKEQVKEYRAKLYELLYPNKKGFTEQEIKDIIEGIEDQRILDWIGYSYSPKSCAEDILTYE